MFHFCFVKISLITGIFILQVGINGVLQINHYVLLYHVLYSHRISLHMVVIQWMFPVSEMSQTKTTVKMYPFTVFWAVVNKHLWH